MKAFIISDFSDIGTGERFKAGTVADVKHGTFLNYEAAGLVRAPKAVDTKPSSDTRDKPAA